MHELKTFDDGKTALVITSEHVNSSGLNMVDNGFLEVDVRTGDTLFEWSPLPHIDFTESHKERPWDDDANRTASAVGGASEANDPDTKTAWDWM